MKIMNLTKMKWVAAILPALFVGLFEFARHDLLDRYFPTSWGNVMAACVAGTASLLYFHGVFTMVGNLYKKLQTEKEEKATLEERDRIARELHDSVSQAVFYMNLKAKEIETALQRNLQPVQQVIELREALHLADGDIRQHIFNLKMASKANLDFATSVQAYIKHFQDQSGIQVDLRTQGECNRILSNPEKNQLIRIFQEILWNIRKHANSKQIHVGLFGEKHGFLMLIQDNGIGFEQRGRNGDEHSFGLKIVQERAQSINADVVIESQPGKGTTVTVSLNF